MTIPKWIDPKISLGNILTIIGMLAAVFGFAQSYGATMQKLDQTVTEVVSLRQSDIEIKADAVALGKVVADERLSTATTLAEMKTDIGYIRRYVEDEKRASRP